MSLPGMHSRIPYNIFARRWSDSIIGTRKGRVNDHCAHIQLHSRSEEEQKFSVRGLRKNKDSAEVRLLPPRSQTYSDYATHTTSYSIMHRRICRMLVRRCSFACTRKQTATYPIHREHTPHDATTRTKHTIGTIQHS